MEREFIIFFLNYCLDHFFKSKIEMSRKIDVGVSTLMRVMNPPYKFKAGSVPFENMLWYCLQNEIDITPIFDLYKQQQTKRIVSSEGCKLREPPLWQQPCLGAVQNEIERHLFLSQDATRALLQLSRQFGFYLCPQCSRSCFFLETPSCWVIRTVHRMVVMYEQKSAPTRQAN